MIQNEYIQKLANQQSFTRVCVLLTLVLFFLALLLLLIRRREQRLGRNLFVVVLVCILFSQTAGMANVMAMPRKSIVPVSEEETEGGDEEEKEEKEQSSDKIELKITEGLSAAEGGWYTSPVEAELKWKEKKQEEIDQEEPEFFLRISGVGDWGTGFLLADPAREGCIVEQEGPLGSLVSISCQEEGDTGTLTIGLPEDGRYSISIVAQEDFSLSVAPLYVMIDSTPPEIEIHGEDGEQRHTSWSMEREEPTLCSGEEAFSILARDSLSGVKEVFWYLSDKKLSPAKLKEDRTIEWKSYQEPVLLQEEGSFWFYGKGEDEAGNSSICQTGECRIEKPPVRIETEVNSEDTSPEPEVDDIPPVAKLEIPLVKAGNGRMYAMGKTLTIRVEEENFDFDSRPEVLSDVKDGYSFSGWTKEKNQVTGTLVFHKDGAYAVDFQCRDQAGNRSEQLQTGTFYLDRTRPVIRIQGVDHQSVYGSSVHPVIQIEDRNFSMAEVDCSLKGAKSGLLDVSLLSDITETGNGVSIAMNHFPEDKDDVYTLSVQTRDHAGNMAEEEVMFSVDQYGSDYILSDATREVVNRYYVPEAPEIVLSEINCSPILYEVSLSCNGDAKTLEENRDYIVETHGGDGEWMIYTYRIFKENFSKEGAYHLDITSRDQADNISNNQTRGARIDFVLDQTPPLVSVGNLQDGACYREKQHVFTIHAADAASLGKMQIFVNNALYYETDSSVDEISLALKEAKEEQVIRILTADKAGNKRDPMEYHVYVQKNSRLAAVWEKKQTRDTEVKAREQKEEHASVAAEGHAEKETVTESQQVRKGKRAVVAIIFLGLLCIPVTVFVLRRRERHRGAD